jgi:uncharacterized protein YraI
MRTSSCLRLLLGVCLLVVSAAAAAQNAYTTHPVSVFSGPDDSYPMVAELDADASVQVMGCLDDWSWCDVAFGDNRGWLYAPDIVYDYEGGYVPFYTYAPSLGVPVVQFTLGDYWDRYYHGRPWYGRREEWIDRGPPHHRRPLGPPPSAGPPPRSARMEPGEGQPQRPVRLGSADRPRQEAERHDGAGDNRAVRAPEARDARPPEARDARPPEARDTRPPEARDARPPEARDTRPAESRDARPPPREERPLANAEPPHPNAEPPHREERAISPQPQRAPEAAHHEEPRRAEKPGDRPNDTPH